MSRSRNSTLKCECGVAIVEFSIVLPLLILIAIVATELGRAINLDEAAVQYSREAANLAYRECLDRAPGPATRCLNDVQQIVEQYAGRFIANIEIELAIYPADSLSDPSKVIRARPTSLGTKISIDPSTQTINGEIDTNLLTQNGVLIVSEAWVPYDVSLPAIHDKAFNVRNDHLYHATVF